MTAGSAGSSVSSARLPVLVAPLLALLAAPGCRESAVEPDVPEDNVVVAGSGNRRNDPYVANSAAIDGHHLALEVSYANGCRSHAFLLAISKSIRESNPVQLPAVLAHEVDGDTCEAWLTVSPVFGTALVRTRYRQFYGPGPGTVALLIEGVPGEELVYEIAG